MKKQDYKSVKRVLLAILFANFAVAVLKIIFGTAIKSTSMVADGFHSVSDGSSNIAGLIGVTLAAKPIDEKHPYGHNKFETLTGLFISCMLFAMGIKIILETINRFINPSKMDVTTTGLITLLITIIVNILVSKYEYKKGKALNSYILISDSIHTKSDIFASVGVLITLICIRLGLPAIIDSIVSIVIAGFILHAAYEILLTASYILVDGAIMDTEQLKSIIMEISQVKDVHNIRSRGSNDNVFVDMHVMIQQNMNVIDSHRLTHEIEEKIRKEINENIEVFIHVEPY